MTARQERQDVRDSRESPENTEPERVTSGAEHPLRGWRALVVFALFVLVGINLRTVILAVPPVLPQIQGDLSLSYTLTGFLTSLPVLVFGGFALPAGLIAGRVGARRMVAVGLALLAAGALLRSVWPAAAPLFLFTFVLSLGIALAQTAMPVLARQWFPARIGLAAALFSDGLILGEVIAAATTSPLAQLLGPHAWITTFVIWGLPVVIILLLWLVLAPPARPLTPARRAANEPTRQQAEREPRRPRVNPWLLGIVLGCGSLIYFAMNGWVAAYNQAEGHAAMTALALAVLNAAQLPSSLIVTLFAQRLAGRRWPFMLGGGICLAALSGWVWGPAVLEPLWVALLGGGSSLVFVLGIALPPLLAGPREVARLTGTTLTLSYGFAFLGPLAGGALWDLFGVPALAFAPVAAAGFTLIVLGAALPARERFGLHQSGAHDAVDMPPVVGPSEAVIPEA